MTAETGFGIIVAPSFNTMDSLAASNDLLDG